MINPLNLGSIPTAAITTRATVPAAANVCLSSPLTRRHGAPARLPAATQNCGVPRTPQPAQGTFCCGQKCETDRRAPASSGGSRTTKQSALKGRLADVPVGSWGDGVGVAAICKMVSKHDSVASRVGVRKKKKGQRIKSRKEAGRHHDPPQPQHARRGLRPAAAPRASARSPCVWVAWRDSPS